MPLLMRVHRALPSIRRLAGTRQNSWTEYRKEDSCYYTSKLIEVDDVDSIIITKIANIPSNETRRYIGKRQNGMVTECINCRLNNGICDDTISVERIELNPATRKIAKMFSKTRETYFEGVDLWVQDEFIPETQLYDNLGRLVEASFDGKKFRYEHSTNDTANLDVKIYDESGKELGFYKRKQEKDGRELILSLTEKGIELKEKALNIPEAIASCVKLEKDEAIEFFGLLNKVLQGFYGE